MDPLDLQIAMEIRRNEQDLRQMLAAPDANFDEALRLLREVEQVKREFSALCKHTRARKATSSKTLRKKSRKSRSKKRDRKPVPHDPQVAQVAAQLLSMSLK